MTSRLRRLDDAFERRIPPSWGFHSQSRGSGLIGFGAAVVPVSLSLLVVLLLTDGDLFTPIMFLALGLVALPTGICLNRRRSSE